MDLDNMELPLSDANEDLETLSRRKLSELFTPALFEIRDETVRDKGIDCTIEIKRRDRYTNFRINVQLKSKHKAAVHPDASVSLTIATSNLQYLLNGAIPAYYILYIKSLDQCYYREVTGILKDLTETKPGWEQQGSQTIRIKDVLTPAAISQIYDHCRDQGLFQRRLQEELSVRAAGMDDSVTIDGKRQVASDSGIRDSLEQIGFQWVNEGRWQEIIESHRRATGHVNTTARYNLIVGIAHYYTSRRFEALSFFKAALRLKDQLSPTLTNYLLYFDFSLKCSLGLIDDATYQAETDRLETDEDVGAYIQIEKAKNAYIEGIREEKQDRLQHLLDRLNDIILSKTASHNVQLLARCEQLFYLGNALNMDYMKSIAMINAFEAMAGPDMPKRARNARDISTRHLAWMEDMRRLQAEATAARNFFAFHIAWMYQVKVMYEFSVYVNIMQVAAESQRMAAQLPDPESPLAAPLLRDLDHIIDFYTRLGHQQNICFALSLRYEVQHYLGNFAEAQATLEQLERMILEHDLKEQRRGLNYLKSEGPAHQRFHQFLAEIFGRHASDEAEHKQLVAQMEQMDATEQIQAAALSAPAQTGDTVAIDCFPIGYFRVPTGKLPQFFDIIRARSPEVRDAFEAILALGAMPVANLFYPDILQEGPVDGHLADKGIASWRHIYAIRKQLFDAGMMRVIIATRA